MNDPEMIEYVEHMMLAQDLIDYEEMGGPFCRGPFLLCREIMSANVDPESLLQESPLCRLIKAIHDNDVPAVVFAIENGAVLTDNNFNVLDFAIKKHNIIRIL